MNDLTWLAHYYYFQSRLLFHFRVCLACVPAEQWPPQQVQRSSIWRRCRLPALTARRAGGPGGLDLAGMFWLLLYILLSLVTTVLNKAIFVNVGWPFPMELSLVH